MTAAIQPGFWDLGYLDGEHRDHWESLDPGRHLTPLLADGTIPRSGTVLDLGCGGGLEAIFLAERGLRVVALDRSLAGLDVLRRRRAPLPEPVAGRILACRGSVRCLPVADASIDFALDRGCLHVLDPEGRPGVAREVHRVLRPGARWVIHGALEDDEEAGVLSVSGKALDRDIVPAGFERGRTVAVAVDARAGRLPGCLTLLQRQPRTG